MKKLMAIGNTLMGDDGIGIKVGKELEEDLIRKGWKVIVGETDMDYCLWQIEEEDLIVIMDGTLYGTVPGTVTVCPLKQMKAPYKKGYSQHDLSLLQLVSMYYPNQKGYFIGIEIEKIEFGLEISHSLDEQFHRICTEIKNHIQDISNENYIRKP